MKKNEKLKKNQAENIKNHSFIKKTLLILGEKETGKTSIILKYLRKKIPEYYMPTIVLDFQKIEMNFLYGNLLLMLYDSCGYELELRLLPSNIYTEVSAYIIVCSYDIRDSLDNLKLWINHVQSYNNRNHNSSTMNNSNWIPIIILINKCDLKKDRTFKMNDVINIIDDIELNILVYEVSVEENYKIDFVFNKIIGLITGKTSMAAETCVNTSYNDDMRDIRTESLDFNRTIKTNRKKSFQLNNGYQEIKSDRKDKKHKSCC